MHRRSARLLPLAHAAFVALAALATAPAAAQSISVRTNPVGACGNMQVAYADMPVTGSAKGNWIAIAEAHSPQSVNTYRFVYLPAQANGQVRFSTRGLVPFTPYEVRAFLDWEGTHSYAVVARETFVVMPSATCAPGMFTRVNLAVNEGESVDFAYQGLRNSSSNWVALAAVGANNPIFLKWQRLPPGSRGESAIDTSGLLPGTYELRLFEDWDRTHEYFIFDRVQVTVR